MSCVGNFGQGHRGSAGAEDFVTPTLKSDTYTTGRGGTGNMAKNENPDVARLAQDVAAPAVREPENFHYGRGGAANIAKAPSEEGKKESKERKSNDGIAEKGKEFLERILNGGKK
jgi:hypothetical protein